MIVKEGGVTTIVMVSYSNPESIADGVTVLHGMDTGNSKSREFGVEIRSVCGAENRFQD